MEIRKLRKLDIALYKYFGPARREREMIDEPEFRCGRHLLVALHDCLCDNEDRISVILVEKLEEAMICCGENDLKETVLYFSYDESGNAQLLKLREAWQILHGEMTVLTAGIHVHTDSLVEEGKNNV